MLKVKKTQKKSKFQQGQTQSKRLIQIQVSKLASIRRLFEALLSEQQQQLYTEQVLIDCIMQLEDVIQFRNRLDGQGQPATEPLEQQPGLLKQHSIHSSSSTNSSSRYVTSLLSKIPPQQVRDMLCWSSVDWMAEFTQSYERIPMLLDIVEREQAPEDTASYMSIVQQQLDEAVDRYMVVGITGSIFADIVGVHLGYCTARNQITQQIEVAPDRHWCHVANKLHLTQLQLLQLTAGYQLFVQTRKADQLAQLMFADLVSCPNTCSLQLLAAAKQADTSAAPGPSPSVWQHLAQSDAAAPASGADASTSTSNGASSADATAACTSQPAVCSGSSSGRQACHAQQQEQERAIPAASTLSGCAAMAAAASGGGGGGGGGGDGGNNAADAATAPSAAEGRSKSVLDDVDPVALINRLVGMLNRSSVAIQLLLFNTLTRRQLARTIVSAYPFIPRAAPILEAATAGVCAPMWLQYQDASNAAAAAAAAVSSSDEQLSWRHSQQRTSLLQQQCSKWWLE